MKKVLFVSAKCEDAAALVYRARGTWSVRLFDAAAGLAQHLLSHRYDCVFVDVARAGADGFALLAEAAGVPAHPPLFVLSRETAPLFAVKAVDLGALDYFTFPCDVDAIDARVSPVCAQAGRVPSNREDPLPFPLVGSSEAMRSVRDLVRRYAPLGDPVLVTGETGVGKELVARHIHSGSRRRDEALIHVNCAALPESIAESELFGHAEGAFTGAVRDRAGKFEIADGGSLFLDEVGELPLSLQPKLLRALQEGEIQRIGSDRHHRVDVRVIAATNRDLLAEVERGRFRADLYHRLAVYPIRVPSLRERREDIPILASHFADSTRRRLGSGPLRLDGSVRARLSAADWPGNVRELENVVSRAVLRAVAGRPPGAPIVVGLEHVDVAGPAGQASPPGPAAPPSPGGPLREQVEEFERRLIREAVARHGGNQAAAARELGMHRANLHHLARRLGLRS